MHTKTCSVAHCSGFLLNACAATFPMGVWTAGVRAGPGMVKALSFRDTPFLPTQRQTGGPSCTQTLYVLEEQGNRVVTAARCSGVCGIHSRCMFTQDN